MGKTYILLNHLAGTDGSEENVRALKVILDGITETLNITKITSYAAFTAGV